MNNSDIIAASAFFVAILSLLVSFWQAWLQRDFNRKSLKPLPWFYLDNKDGNLRVDFYNDGQGPLIINDTIFERGEIKGKHIWEVLPEGTEFDSAKMLSRGKIIGSRVNLTLFSKKFDENDTEVERKRDDLRGILGSIKATITYHDLYGYRDKIERSFAFFIENSQR
jgi:hypothetical protein